MIKIKPFCILAGALAFAASCTDEMLEKNNIEKTSGNEVTFKASVSPLKTTRTYYGDYNEETKSYPLYWSSKDNIVVASPMGQEGRDTAVYRIMVPTDDKGNPIKGGAYYAQDIVLNTQYSDAGVQWGKNTETGSFYAIYPYCAETLRRPSILEEVQPIPRYYNSIDVDRDNNKVTATAKVENVQRIWAPKPQDANAGSGTSSSADLLQMYGSNHALVMWAQTDNVTQGDPVNLRFQPLSTCLMMTFSCAELGSVTDAKYPATIEKITIDTNDENVCIAGNMTIEFNSVSTTGDKAPSGDQKYNDKTPTCNLVDGTGSSKIEIIPWIQGEGVESGIHPTIEQGQSMQICAFLLPTQDFDMSNWTISVEVSGNTYSRSLKPEVAGDNNANSTIKKGMIHQIKFPAFNVAQEWNFNPYKWMDDINDNVYLSQITFPGSWESFSADLPTMYPYQSVDFKTQTKRGVRAFDLKTRSYGSVVEIVKDGENEIEKVITPPSNVIITGSQGEYYRNGYSLHEAIGNIAQFIAEEAPTETVVIIMRYEADENSGNNNIDYQYWMYGLEQELKKLDKITIETDDGDIERDLSGYIYTDGITPETTLGDVRGKIILKVKLDDEICANWPTTGDYVYGNSLPALISYAPISWVANSYVASPEPPYNIEGSLEDFSLRSLTSILHWQTWDKDWNNKLINGAPNGRPNLFAWNFSCTNRTFNGSGTAPTGIPTSDMRQKALDGLLAEAIDVYNLGYHNEWFLFGCGGMYATSLDATPNNNDINTFTVAMNKWLNGQINAFFSNYKPCPLGIVLFNQVGNDNSNFQGNSILTNLIKINNTFYLQADQSRPERYPKAASAPKKNSKSSGSYESNGWTVN